MCPTDLLGTTFADLAARLDAADTLPRWAIREPALTGLTDVGDLRRLLHGYPSARSDAAFGALLRIASRTPLDRDPDSDGVDAALLAAHLLQHAISNIAWSLRDLSADIETLVAGTAWVLIRTDRWSEQRSGYAQTLLLETRRAVLIDLRPARRTRTGGWRPGPLLLDQDRMNRRPGGELDPLSGTPGHPADPEQELCELLAWAQRTGVVSAEDINALIEVELASVAQRRAMAAERGCLERQLRRQKQTTLRRLHDARLIYLGEVA